MRWLLGDGLYERAYKLCGHLECSVLNISLCGRMTISFLQNVMLTVNYVFTCLSTPATQPTTGALSLIALHDRAREVI